MPKSIPSVGDANWGQPLNAHLGQFNNPVYGGPNIWNDADGRPWQEKDYKDHQAEDFGYTGYNKSLGVFERWEVNLGVDPNVERNARWTPLQKNSPTEIPGIGQVRIFADKYPNTNNYYYYLATRTAELSNGNFDEPELRTLVSLGDTIIIDDTGRKLYYNVVGFQDGRTVVRQVQTNFVTYQPSGGVTVKVRATLGNPRFQVIDSNGNPVSDFFKVGDKALLSTATGGGTTLQGIEVARKYNANEYDTVGNMVRTFDHFIQSISRAADAHRSYTIVFPAGKYLDDEGNPFFVANRVGVVETGPLEARVQTNLNTQSNYPMLTSNSQILRDVSGEVYSSMSGESYIYALKTGETVTNFAGKILTSRRGNAQDINSGASASLEDWDGEFNADNYGLWLNVGHGANLKTPTKTITTPRMTALVLRGGVTSGKIASFRHIHIRCLSAFANNGNAELPNEVWSIYEEGATIDFVQGQGGTDDAQFNTRAKNFFQGATQFGSTNGNNSGFGNATWTGIDEQLVVYGNAEVRADTGGKKPGNLRVAGTVTANGTVLTSDERLKTKIQELSSAQALETVRRINAKSFEFKSAPDKTRYGVIAQELETVLPELVSEDKDGTKTVNYTELVPFLIESIKAQQAQIDELRDRLDQR